MSANFSIYSTGVRKKFYERTKLTEQGKKQLWQFLFPEEDIDTASDFLLDQLITNTYGVSYRTRDMQSNVREYQAGKGTVITPPRASEKTPVTEKLRDAVVAGMNGNDGATEQASRLMDNIAKQHISAFNMTKNRQALDVFVEGEFFARGTDGVDLDLDIDFGRSGSVEKTYDFTAVGATFSDAVSEVQAALLSAGSSVANMFAIIGSSWREKYAADTALRDWQKANQAQMLYDMQNVPAEFSNVEGLTVLGRAHIEGLIQPVWILDYTPGTLYRDKKGEAGEAFIAATKAIFGSLGDMRYSVKRGVDALDGSGKAIRSVGDIVFDEFTEKDPVATWIRGQSRHCFVPGDVNTTAVSVGTFS